MRFIIATPIDFSMRLRYYRTMEVVPMINRPLYVDKIMAYTDTPFVKVLTGVRRCGKSTVLKMIMEKLQQEHDIPYERIVSMRFDSMDYEDMTAKDMFKAVKEKLNPTGRTYLFLDEVQEIEGWEKVVNSLATDYDVDLYVTGSNSRMMSSEIATYLTGRYVSFRIYTLSFQEYLEFKKQYTQVKDIHAELADYIRLGGFPATHLREYSQDEVYTIVRDIYNSTIFSDIVKRNQIRKIDQLERVVRYTFANVGNSFSAKSISDYLKSEHRSIDNETVYSYLEKLEKAYLLHRCSRYDLRGKEILKTQEKFYLADTALRYSVLGYTPDSVASSLENVVYLELCRRGYTVTIGKTPDGEVDFVAQKQNDRLYVQVTQEIKSEKTEMEEKKSFKVFSGTKSRYLAEKICQSLGCELGDLSITHFADGEFEVCFEESIRGRDVFLVQSTFPNADNLMELLLMIDAAKRASAKTVNAVIPYFGWARQDRKSKPRVSIAAKLVADMLSVAGISRMITMDLHADQEQGFFNVPVDHLYASSVLLPYIQSLNLENLVIATPDVGGTKRASTYSKFLNCPLVLCNKSRRKANEVASMEIIGDVTDANVVLVDDMVDTAGTITKAADLMKSKGARTVRAIASHCVMSGPASERVQNSALEELVFTDSIPYNNACSKVKELSIADLIANTIRQGLHILILW